MNIDESIIVADFKTLLDTHLLPVHLNLKKRTTISFQNDIPKKQIKRVKKPTISNLFCPYCMRLMSTSNGSAKNNKHFSKVHKNIVPKNELELFKFVRDNGLNYYRIIQLSSLYYNSNDTYYKEQIKKRILVTNSIDNEDDVSIKIPNVIIKYPDSNELKYSISIKLFKIMSVDWIRIFFLKQTMKFNIV